MQKNEAIAIAAPLFKSHQVDEFHITSDEQAFFNEGSAASYASTLKDKDVIKVTRAEAEAGDDEAKAQAAKDKKILTLEKKLQAKSDQLKDLQAKEESETDEKKKAKLGQSIATLTEELKTINSDLEALQGE